MRPCKSLIYRGAFFNIVNGLYSESIGQDNTDPILLFCSIPIQYFLLNKCLKIFAGFYLIPYSCLNGFY